MRKFQAALATLAAVAALAATAARADDGDTHGYASVGYQTGDFGTLGKGLNAISLSGALSVWKFVSVEGDVGIGSGSKTTDFMGTHANTKLENDLAVYGVGTFPVSPNVDLFARLGYLTAKARASAPGFSGEQQESGPAVGVGVHVFPHGGKNGVALEYNYADFKHGGSGLAQLSFVHRF